jgi:type IX secretion system PorP/SprF family membrane protein
MKKITTYILPFIAMLFATNIHAQQNSLFNTYSLDPLQLNIAYAGASCTEANVHYRTQWLSLQNSPKLLQLNAHTALGQNHALALKVNSQTQGLLNTLGAMLGYSYRIKLNENSKLHIGLGLGWTQTALNAQKAVVIDANDGALNNNSKQTANGFDSELGLMVVGKKLKAGVSALHLYNSNPSFTGNSAYKALPQLNTQLSYIFNKDKKVEIEPWLLNRFTIKGDNIVEGMLNFNFVKVITVGVGYRSGYGAMALVGAKIKNVKLGYSFDYGITKNATNTGSSHQITLGFSMCKTEKPKPKEEPIVATPTPTNLPTVEEVASTTLSSSKEEPKKEEVAVKEEPKVEPIKEDIIPKLNIIAEEVVFKLNKSQLDEEGLKKLDEIASVMKTDPTVVINVIGHTCNKGGKELNDLLSIRRATYVRNELIKRGVNAENINRSIGVGSENEIFDNDSEQQSKNRTVRFESSK